MYKLFILLVLFSSTIYAKDKFVSPLDFQSPMSVNEDWQGFFTGSHLQTWWRAVYFKFHNKYNYSAQTPNWQQSSLGGMINWMSGYVDDVFGMNASVFGAHKLHTKGKNPTDWGVHIDTQGRPKSYFGRIARFNTKFRLGNEKQNVLIHAGYVGLEGEYLPSYLLSVEPHKLTMSSERGITLKSNIDKWSLYGAWLDRIAYRTGSGFTSFSNSTPGSQGGQKIDHVFLAGAGYDNQSWSFNLEYAEGNKYLRQIFGQATYNFLFDEKHNMIVNGQYYDARKVGDLWQTSAYSQAFDKKGNLANLNVKFNLQKFNIVGALSKVKAKSTKGRGNQSNFFYYSPAGNYAPSVPFSTSRMSSDFNFNKEQVYLLSCGYDFNDLIKGLSIQLTQTYGNHIDKNTGVKSENEVDLLLTYYLPNISGFWVDLETSRYFAKNNHWLPKSQAQRFYDFRVWFNYQLHLF